MAIPQIRISNTAQRLDWTQPARRYLANRWVLLALGGGVLIAGAALNWSWLVAAGVAPIIISLAPCAIMCGLGLCGMKMMGGSCEKQSASSSGVKDAGVGPDALRANTMDRDRLGRSNCCNDSAEPQTAKQAVNERNESHA